MQKRIFIVTKKKLAYYLFRRIDLLQGKAGSDKSTVLIYSVFTNVRTAVSGNLDFCCLTICMKNCKTLLEEKKKKNSLSSIFLQSVFLLHDFKLYT